MIQPSRPSAEYYEDLIPGTEKRCLPAWLECQRIRLNRFVKFHTRHGLVPISEYKSLRIKIEGKELTKNQKLRWFREAQVWQDLLLKKSDSPAPKGAYGHHDDCVRRTGTN